MDISGRPEGFASGGLELYAFTEADFLVIKQLVHEHTGIYLDHSKRFLVQTRLSRRLKQLGLKSFREYRRLLQNDDGSELEHLANAITTNTTAFFRHDHQFEFLAERLAERQAQGGFDGEIRIWSAGCSTGEEPYTIAWVVNRVLRPENRAKVKILATDIDSEALAVAEAGIYPEEVVAPLAGQYDLRGAFLRGTGPYRGFVKVRPELRERVTFRRLNLIRDWSVKRPVHYLFCRNVCIYFHKDTQRALMERLADTQDEGDYLFLGQSESLFSTCNLYARVAPAIYRKLY
ncbi:MAG: chemotaxis protein methyltransferase 3 [Gammaproteobacteria bacterium]|nr:MAG: chemotaxis protein methyltransferase 3 [Gammaproteobacteria bacterium]